MAARPETGKRFTEGKLFGAVLNLHKEQGDECSMGIGSYIDRAAVTGTGR
ncbi:MAG: hypothetical protein ABW185_05220 [Sedimenticola sp.]